MNERNGQLMLTHEQAKQVELLSGMATDGCVHVEDTNVEGVIAIHNLNIISQNVTTLVSGDGTRMILKP